MCVKKFEYNQTHPIRETPDLTIQPSLNFKQTIEEPQIKSTIRVATNAQKEIHVVGNGGSSSTEK